jgi:hypothetical protein
MNFAVAATIHCFRYRFPKINRLTRLRYYIVVETETSTPLELKTSCVLVNCENAAD